MTSTEARSGLQLPTPGRYAIDPVHSAVTFVVRHLMVSRVRGRLNRFEGAITAAERPEDSAVEVTIDASSIDTGDDQRDGHLRSPDFLDVERFGQIRFRSTGVRPLGGDRFAVDGDLTLRDVTRPVVLDVIYAGAARDPWGGERIGFSASTEINREDWGLTWNQALETGGVLVGKTVRIELEVEATRVG